MGEWNVPKRERGEITQISLLDWLEAGLEFREKKSTVWSQVKGFLEGSMG